MAHKIENNPSFFTSSYFFKQLLLILLVFGGLLLLGSFILRIITKHGQQIEVPSLVGLELEDAENRISDLSLDILVMDSIFMVGKKPNTVISQSPSKGSLVKSGRIVYLTITKAIPDQIPFGRLPILYGKSFDRKQKELAIGFEIQSKVIAEEFDSGPPGYILAVLYKGDTISNKNIKKQEVMIEKGSTLEFVITKPDGGEVKVPDLVCKTLEEAEFFLSTLYIKLETDHPELLASTPKKSIYVSSQSRSVGSNMTMGEIIEVKITKTKPAECGIITED